MVHKVKSGYPPPSPRGKRQVSDRSGFCMNFKSVESYLQFYENIPDYSELHHLPDDEFYSRLNSLKTAQQRFCGDKNVGEDNQEIPMIYCSSASTLYGPDQYEERNTKAFDSTRLGRPTKMKPPPQINVISDSDHSDVTQTRDKSTAATLQPRDSDSDSAWDKDNEVDRLLLSDEEGLLDDRKTKSLPSSPSSKSKLCPCGPPKVYRKYRVRSRPRQDERTKNPLMKYHVHGDHEQDKRVEGRKMKLHSRPVPLLSRIPLFDRIMAQQEVRRRVGHRRYSRELQALVRPFSFTKKEEEHKLLALPTCSNPEPNISSRAQTPFRAKPIPKNLFSNLAYERMREDEFYRALKKRIRAEEMLRSSSLPPSMAAREHKYRSKSLDFLNGRTCKSNKTRGYRRACEGLRKEIQVDVDEKVKRVTRCDRSAWFTPHRRRSTTDSSETSPYESVSEPERRGRCRNRPSSTLSVNRSNLASVLRTQAVRKRMEVEVAENMEESRMKEEAKFKARLVRMTPAWRGLNYSTEEDLALRVAARREEERLRREHHHQLMGTIYTRVHQIPPLFQRQASPPKYKPGNKKPVRNDPGEELYKCYVEDERHKDRGGCMGEEKTRDRGQAKSDETKEESEDIDSDTVSEVEDKHNIRDFLDRQGQDH